MSGLIKYEAACRALAEAKAVDEVKDLRDKADAMRIYAMQSKNKTLEIDAAEIRIRAERRLGEMIIAQKSDAGLNTGKLKQGPVLVTDEGGELPKLSDAGISYDLSSRAQKIAAVPEAEFEAEVGEWRERVSAENERVTTRLTKAGEKATKKPAPVVPDVDDLREQMEEMRHALKGAIADNEIMGRIIDADDKLAAAQAEITRWRAVAENAERTLTAKNGEYVERARAVTMWKNRADKAEKELARLNRAAA